MRVDAGRRSTCPAVAPGMELGNDGCERPGHRVQPLYGSRRGAVTGATELNGHDAVRALARAVERGHRYMQQLDGRLNALSDAVTELNAAHPSRRRRVAHRIPAGPGRTRRAVVAGGQRWDAGRGRPGRPGELGVAGLPVVSEDAADLVLAVASGGGRGAVVPAGGARQRVRSQVRVGAAGGGLARAASPRRHGAGGRGDPDMRAEQAHPVAGSAGRGCAARPTTGGRRRTAVAACWTAGAGLDVERVTGPEPTREQLAEAEELIRKGGRW